MNNNFRLYSNKELLKLITIANKYKPRFLVDTIINMIENKDDEKVIEIFGNRRTGKTIAMYHTIKRLLETENISKFIYIRCFNGGNVADICEILDSLEEVIEYIFIDEITYLDDIVCAINQITDGYPSKTIVLTGSSSLSFLFSEPVLFGRCKKVNTTFISYKEWGYLKDDNTDIFEYIHNCGILDNTANPSEYLNEFMNLNISSSLEKYVTQSNYVNPYIHEIEILAEKYPGLIIKITEDFSNKLSLANIKKPFKFYKLGNRYLNNKDFKEYLIREINSEIGSNLITVNGLDLLEDLLIKCDFYCKLYDLVYIPSSVEEYQSSCLIYNHTLGYHLGQMQPCIMYYQSFKIIKDLQTFGLLEENFNLQKYLQDIDERILEDIVRIHLMLHFNSDDNNSIVIKSFRLGNLKEIDVVVDDIESSSSYLIEVKRNSKYHKNYGVWLVDDEIATIYKNTKDRILLYNGYTDTIKQNNRIIKCINIEEFLLNIDKFISFEENINGFKKLEI